MLVLGAALAAALRYAPFFEVEQVSLVVGNDQVSVEQVLAAAEVPDGRRVDVGARAHDRAADRDASTLSPPPA